MIDIGTNGEMVLGNRQRMVTCIFRTVDDCGRACIETESGLCVFHFEEASLRPLSE